MIRQNETATGREIREILKERILVMDGAMGTTIQNYKLQESDYRGEKFKDFQKDLKGNNDLLSLTRPEIIEEIHGFTVSLLHGLTVLLNESSAFYLCSTLQ